MSEYFIKTTNFIPLALQIVIAGFDWLCSESLNNQTWVYAAYVYNEESMNHGQCVLPLAMRTTLVLVAILVAALPAAQGEDSDPGSLKVFPRVFDKCSGDPDMFSCLKLKAVTLLDRALTLDSLPVSEYLSITRDPSAKVDQSVFQSKEDLEASLPRDLGQKSSILDRLLQDRLSKYLETRTIQLNIPKDVFEGREKGFKGYKSKDKGGGVFLVFGAFFAMMLQLALGKIALIAGKALLVGKVALLLAGILGLRSLLHHGHGESHSSQVIYAEPEHHGGWGRSLGTKAGDSQEIVYRGQRPSP
ncbi:hypothetical protein J6590_000958 [Homalodisca vitripennis]|nr:hypothetical protein J6590_000958 [Homalodisca vitripennis]